MRSFTRRILVLVISGILLGTTGAMLPGCTARRVIVVKSQHKPAARVETRPRRPSIYYVWVPGYWKGKPGHWTWAPGYWEHRGGQPSVDKEHRKVTPSDEDGRHKPAAKQGVRPERPSADRGGHQSVGKKNTKVSPSDVDGHHKPTPKQETKSQRPSADPAGHQSVGKKNTKATPGDKEGQHKSAKEVRPERPSADAEWRPGCWKGKPGRWAATVKKWRDYLDRVGPEGVCGMDITFGTPIQVLSAGPTWGSSELPVRSLNY